MIEVTYEELMKVYNSYNPNMNDLDKLYVFLTNKIASQTDPHLKQIYKYEHLGLADNIDKTYASRYSLCALDEKYFNGIPYTCHIEEKSYTLELNYRKLEKSNCLEILLKIHDRVRVSDDGKKMVGYALYTGSCPVFKLLVFDDLNVYTENQRGRLIPCSLAHLSFIIGKHKNNCLCNVINFLLEFFSLKNFLFKDIHKELLEAAIPVQINLNNIWNYKDKRGLIAAHCKRADVPKSVNKYSLHFGYILMKCARYVDSSELQKLLIIKDDLDELKYMFRVKPQIEKVFSLYYTKVLYPNIDTTDSDEEIENSWLIIDYVRMVMQHGSSKKFNLKIKSIKRIREEHDKVSDELYRKKTPKVTIPKNSKFKDLKLPDEFEHITTRKRLIRETTIQHHCVWSYATSINKDVCAIYSTIYEGERYTLEFRKTKKSYTLNQIKGRFNTKAPDELIESVKKHLKDINSKKV